MDEDICSCAPVGSTYREKYKPDNCSCTTAGSSLKGSLKTTESKKSGPPAEGSFRAEERFRSEECPCSVILPERSTKGSVKSAGSKRSEPIPEPVMRLAEVKVGGACTCATNVDLLGAGGAPVSMGSARGAPASIGSARGAPASMGSARDAPASVRSARGAPVSTGTQPILDPNCDPNNPRMLTYDMIRAARRNIEGAVVKTPLTRSKLSELYGMNVYLKAEFLQFTGSFKERGARHALMSMPPDQKKSGAVSASAGNHALALCYHGQQLGVPVTVVMPTTAPIMKIQNCKAFGADIVVAGQDLTEAKGIAQGIARDKGALYINGYDHIDVLAGQGTIGIEILEQLPTASVVIVPAGGGGLISGVAVAIKTLKPCTRVIGVESENCPSFTNSLKAGKPVATTSLPTVADGLAVSLPGVNSVFTAKNYVDKMIVVKEDDIAVGILRLIEKEKFIIEGAGATTIAAIASGQLDEFKGKNVVVVLSGGNIDSTVLGRVLERGLAADGRYLKVYVTVSDRPGGVADLIKLISAIGVSIKFVSQERKWLIVDVFSVMVKVVCETRDWEHALELKRVLEENYKNVTMVHVDFPPSTIAGKDEG